MQSTRKRALLVLLPSPVVGLLNSSVIAVKALSLRITPTALALVLLQACLLSALIMVTVKSLLSVPWLPVARVLMAVYRLRLLMPSLLLGSTLALALQASES